MSYWDKVQSKLKEQGSKLVDSAAEGAIDASIKHVMGIFTENERKAHQGFEASAQQQSAGRLSPTVEYQNRGEPLSAKPEPAQRRLVGDEQESPKRDNKLMIVGGGIAAFAVLFLTIYTLKK